MTATKSGVLGAVCGLVMLALTICPVSTANATDLTTEIAYTDADPERVVFGKVYENHAWGYEKLGCDIRADGRIMLYRVDESTLTIQGYDQVGHVAVEEVQQMADLLPAAAQQELSEPRPEMMDFGQANYFGITEGQAVGLKMWGDWASDNPSSEAMQLVIWLDKIFPEACPL